MFGIRAYAASDIKMNPEHTPRRLSESERGRVDLAIAHPGAEEPGEMAPAKAGSPTAVTLCRLPQHVACGFPALRFSDDDAYLGTEFSILEGEMV